MEDRFTPDTGRLETEILRDERTVRAYEGPFLAVIYADQLVVNKRGTGGNANVGAPTMDYTWVVRERKASPSDTLRSSYGAKEVYYGYS
jgi:hypothetical protein